MNRRIQRLMLSLLSAALFLLLLTGCGYAGPERAVRREMELIQKLDEPTIKTFVAYENIRLSGSAPLEIGEETTQAVKLFFKNFSFRIRSSSVSEDGTTASVDLYITNLDAKMLAQDLCRAMIRASVSQEGSEEPQGLASSFALMKMCLEEHSYPIVTLPVTVNLTNQNGTWVIQESAELEDALAGGLVSYLRDPYLLTPQDVLECTLQPFGDFTAQEWIRYLDMDDVFNTGSSLAPEMDLAMAEQISRFFGYEILEVTQNDQQASARITIRSLNLKDIMNRCRSYLLSYASTTESIRATDEEITLKAAEFLLDALKNNSQSSTNTIELSMTNNGYTWEVLLSEDFADALLGGVDIATETLYAAPEESSEASDPAPEESSGASDSAP